MKHAKHASMPDKVTWRAPSHLYKSKTLLWYTNVSIFFFVVFVALLALNNWLGIVVLAFAFWVFLSKANEKPKIVDYTVSQFAIEIDDRTIHYEELAAFSVDHVHGATVILLESSYPFSLPITLIVKDAEVERALMILLQHLPMHDRLPILQRVTHWLHY